MTAIDREGRLFGRFNLVDAAVVAFMLVLLPVAYATFLLFRPARPAIESVTEVPVTDEERRVSGAGLLLTKLKVKGSGFNPLLRAKIGDSPAMGFVFENPNSADVIVGVVPPGKHDLVLMDGVQEVARAREAVEIHATDGPSVRVFGFLTGLSSAAAETLAAGHASEQNSPGAFRIIAIGPSQPAKARIPVGERAIDLPLPGQFERAAELVVRCDWPSSRTCAVNGQSLQGAPPIAITLTGGLRFEIEAVDSPEESTAATAVVRLDAPLPALKTGGRDANVGASAAEITAVSGEKVTLRLGVRKSRDGWSYRGQLVMPGARFTLRMNGYLLSGTIESLRIES